MVHHKVCPLCSSEKIGLLLRCYDFFLSKKEFPVFKCADCGFAFTQDYPEEKEISSFYESDDYISHSDTSKGLTNKIYRAVRTTMLSKKKNLIWSATALKTGKILDIGSGTGYFAGTMKAAGWDVRGIEISEKARNFAISHFGLDIVSPDKISDIESESFDCVTLWHVLEHFHDPSRYFSEIIRLLKPGASCIVALPNCNSYDAEYYNLFWAAWDVPRHLWHFNPKTFGLFCKKSALKLEQIKKLPFDVFYISQLSEKYKGSSLSFLRGVSKAFVFAFLSVFHPDRSSSVIYILRKPKD
jgi:2-polyprenyl-3-methyl-5-hydroxy-6-metoxy-1,4-benzoquinol methylase